MSFADTHQSVGQTNNMVPSKSNVTMISKQGCITIFERKTASIRNCYYRMVDSLKPSSSRSASQRRYSASSQARQIRPIHSARSTPGSIDWLTLISLIRSFWFDNFLASQYRLDGAKRQIYQFSLNCVIWLVRNELSPRFDQVTTFSWRSQI